MADAIISQLLLLDAQDPTKVRGIAGRAARCGLRTYMRLPVVDNCTSYVSLQAAVQALSLKLIFLQDIKLFVNSPGGSVTAGMGIYDAIQVSAILLSADSKVLAFLQHDLNLLARHMQHSILWAPHFYVSYKAGQILRACNSAVLVS